MNSIIDNIIVNGDMICNSNRTLQLTLPFIYSIHIKNMLLSISCLNQAANHIIFIVGK